MLGRTAGALGLLAFVTVAPAHAVAPPDSVGQWQTPFPVPVIGTHAILMPNGKVLYWYYPNAAPGSESGIYDPVTGQFTYRPLPRNLFCAGYSYLPDGRVLVVGGDVQPPICPANGQGTADTHIYDPFTDTWTRLDDMHVSRWYPTSLELGDGHAIIVSGYDDSCHNVKVMEEWRPTTGHQVVPAGNKQFSLYPRLHLLSDGRVFHSGPDWDSYMWNPANPTGWVHVDAHRSGSRFEVPSVMLPGMQDVVAIFGGIIGTGVTNTCERIDLKVADPEWQYGAPMHYGRFHNNAVLMPDGKVMIVGGGLTENYEDPVLIPEMYNPATNTWFDLPPHVYGRMYHSTALLLPDGRVLLGGQDDGPSAIYAEIYQPPYLFRGARPVITAAPAEVVYGSSFTIDCASSDSIGSVVLMGLSTVTHSFNNSQRHVPLAFTHPSSTQLQAVAPANGNLAPPGYYMLFVLNQRGVPSEAHMMRIGVALADVAPSAAPRTLTVRAVPNPVVEGTAIHYTLPRAAEVRTVLVDVSGRVVRELEHGARTAGTHTVAWDGRDHDGVRVQSGRYWCVVRAGDDEQRGSLVVIR